MLGTNTVPAEIWIDTLDDALKLLGKQRDMVRFQRIVDTARAAQPALIGLLEKRPLRALALADAWERLLDVVLPGEAFDAGVQEVSRFARRYGLRDKPARAINAGGAELYAGYRQFRAAGDTGKTGVHHRN